MGRPSMGLGRIPVRLPKQMIDDIDALAGKQKRAQFIREAVQNEIERRTEDLLTTLTGSKAPRSFE